MFLPMVPTFGTDMAAKFTIHEERISVVAPRTAKINQVYTLCCRQPAMIEYIAEGLILRSGGSCDVAVDEALDGAVLKPGGGRAEDKVGGAADIAVFKVEPCGGHAGIDGILMADKSAVDKDETVALGMQGYGLSESGGVVLDGEVLQGDVVSLDLQCVCAEGTHGLSAGFGGAKSDPDVGVVVVGNDGVLGTLTADFNVLQPLGDDEFFFVDAVFYINDLMVVHKSTAYFDGLVDGSELTGAVAGNDDSVGVVIARSGLRFAK